MTISWKEVSPYSGQPVEEDAPTNFAGQGSGVAMPPDALMKKKKQKLLDARTKVVTYAAALFLLKDKFKESVDDPDMFEKEFMKYLKENDIELDNEISEEVIGFGEVLPKGNYVLVNDILNKEEEELSAKKGDKVVSFADEPPVDTVLGVDIFPVVHVKTQEKIYVSLEDIKDDN